MAEFQDNPVGSGDGRFAGKRYFFGRHDHALFLPNTNLMRADEYHLQVAKYGMIYFFKYSR